MILASSIRIPCFNSCFISNWYIKPRTNQARMQATLHAKRSHVHCKTRSILGVGAQLNITQLTMTTFRALTLLAGLGWHPACKNCPLLSVNAPQCLHWYDTGWPQQHPARNVLRLQWRTDGTLWARVNTVWQRSTTPVSCGQRQPTSSGARD